MRRVLLVLLPLVLLVPLAGCADQYPWRNAAWPNGRWVHPRVVQPPDLPPDGWDRAACLVGLTQFGQATVDTFDEMPEVDEFYWWVIYDYGIEFTATQQSCMSWLFSRPFVYPLQYDCGLGLHPYFYHKDPDNIGVFVQYFLCDQNGYAYWQCPGGCIGIYGAENAVENGGPMLFIDPTHPTGVPIPIECVVDPRDTRVCLPPGMSEPPPYEG